MSIHQWPLKLLVISTLSLYSPLLAAENLLRDGSFELGKGWRLFVPDGTDNKTVNFSYLQAGLKGSMAGRLSTEKTSRVGIDNNRSFVIPGERYKVVFYYKPEPNGAVASGSPGVVFRINPIDDDNARMAPIYILVDGKVVSNITSLASVPPLANEWTKVEATVVVPPKAASFGVNLFLWNYQGAVLFDNVSLELVPSPKSTTE